MFAATLATFVLGYSAPSGEILLVDFKGLDDPVTHTWRTNNDPVMGGRSVSSVAIENDALHFVGTCAIVPSLQAPGFITAVNSDKKDFVDVSSCAGLRITGSATTDYAGFRLSFGSAKPIGGKFFAAGYKQQFFPSIGSIGTVDLPFTNFTDFWDDATGKPIHTCQENPNYCPDTKTLTNMKTMSLWAEGVEGDVDISIVSIAGYGCTSR
eukprot:CAMPEP_0183352082 /NCGR_PEP_ID=MMETSP0164_2-20130417/27446_1 /TAXON_ID=221442 /ORGANISM="Coccolithus pelagicus ssp braarudi, Strain PLY182g" /LENGTH=209 /DNA_ID=CAMNT_0025524435 /DNA_START=46 /DNA_END=675 /DNA_ORIENTATION=+